MPPVTRAQRRDHEGGDAGRGDPHAGEFGGARIVADGENALAEHGDVQAPIAERRGDDEDADRDRERSDHRHVVQDEAAEGAEIVGEIAARRSARPHHRRAVDAQQHAERRDDRRHLQERDDHAVEDADAKPIT